MKDTRGAICLAAPEFLGITQNGGIAASFSLKARLLAEHGWRVHVLYCGADAGPEELEAVRREMAEVGIGFTHLGDYPEPAEFAVETVFPPNPLLVRSDRVLAALIDLHSRERFDLIQFADWLGLGFRPIQAQRARLAFADAGTIVQLHGMQAWVREHNRLWLAGPETAIDEFAEQQAFELANFQIAASRYILDYARELDWRVRDDAEVSPNTLGPPTFRKAWFRKEWSDSVPPAELVFFGRLEQRKGYELFVEAMQSIDPALPIVFLGKPTLRRDGRPAEEWVRERLPGRRLVFMTDCDRAAALRYLASGNRLALIPSLTENHPHAVAECLVNGIPFLAAATGGTPEVVRDPELQRHLLFEPTAAALVQRLTAYLQAPAAARRAWCERAAATDVAAHNRGIVEQYERWLAVVRARRAADARSIERRPAMPRVTAAVSHYNLGAYLPTALASLAAQTYPNLEVIVVDDGSTDEASLQTVAAMQAAYPHFRFIRQPNAGLAAARNRALAEANGEYFFPLDADNFAAPAMIERLQTALEANPEAGAATSYLIQFADAADGPAAPQPPYLGAHRGTGGPVVVGGLWNVFGDASGLFRTRTLRAAGGYDTRRDVILEDWHLYVKLACTVGPIVVVPEHLLWYRVRPDSMLRQGDEFPGMVRILSELAGAGPLPPAEQRALWTTFFSFLKERDTLRRRLHESENRQPIVVTAEPAEPCLRYRVADKVNAIMHKVPLLHPLGKRLVQTLGRLFNRPRPPRDAAAA